MRLVNKIVYLFVVLANVLVLAQKNGEPPAPTSPHAKAVGPGAAAPIDNYIYLLAIVAILFIIVYARNFKKQVN